MEMLQEQLQATIQSYPVAYLLGDLTPKGW